MLIGYISKHNVYDMEIVYINDMKIQKISYLHIVYINKA